MKRFCLNIAVIGLALQLASTAWSQPQGPPGGQPPAQPGTPGGAARSQFSTGSVESLEDLRSIIIRAPREQLEAMLRVIDEIDRLSQAAEPEIELIPLQHADSESMVDALTAIYEARQTAVSTENAANIAKVSFVALAQPNSVVAITKRSELDSVVALIRQMDQEAADAPDQFKVFPLQRASAVAVQAKLQQFFATRDDAAKLRVRVEVLGDDRTNSVVVHGSPVDIAQAGRLIEQLDSNDNAAINELRVFPLRNAVATELANLLYSAINYQQFAGAAGGLGQAGRGAVGVPGQQAGQQFGQPGVQTGQAGQVGVAGAGVGTTQGIKSTRLRFLAIDDNGRPVESGIIEDITVLPDDRTNSLIVTAPPTSMDLVSALITQLDQMPNPAAELKVFSLKHSDAETMLQTLQSVFSPTTAAAGPAGVAGGLGQTSTSAQARSFALGGEPGALSRIPLTFASDYRTNSIIVSGTPQDLRAVEVVILKLESSTALQQRTVVYPLRNLTAIDAATAMTDFLSAQDALATVQEGRVSLQDQIAREVTVVPEPVTNKLIVSATPRYFDEIMRIITEIDVRPPQVVIQVLIAEVTLSQTDELGVEVGTQSSVLFDRSIVVNNQLSPGFNFNTTTPLTTPTNPSASEIGLQQLSNFALGRGNPALGFGGLVLTASSDNLSVLLRALQQQQRLEVLSRPQVMTSDSRPAQIQIGQDVPIVNGSTITGQGNIVNQIERRQVGIILQVTPRISPDGVVLMDVLPQVSALADTGVPIGTDASGAQILAPVINITQAQTTVAAADGQTVVIGGLIIKQDSKEDRKIPLLGDLPLIGWGFRYRQMNTSKRELLIILTPHIIYSEADAQYVKDMEAKRMQWILSNVEAVHGDIGLTPPPVVVPRMPPGPADCTIIEPGERRIIEEEVISVEELPPEYEQSTPPALNEEALAPEPENSRSGTEIPRAGEATPPQALNMQSLELAPVPIGRVMPDDPKGTMSNRETKSGVTQAAYQGNMTGGSGDDVRQDYEILPIVLPTEQGQSTRRTEEVVLEPVELNAPQAAAPKNVQPSKRGGLWGKWTRNSSSKEVGRQ